MCEAKRRRALQRRERRALRRRMPSCLVGALDESTIASAGPIATGVRRLLLPRLFPLPDGAAAHSIIVSYDALPDKSGCNTNTAAKKSNLSSARDSHHHDANDDVGGIYNTTTTSRETFKNSNSFDAVGMNVVVQGADNNSNTIPFGAEGEEEEEVIVASAAAVSGRAEVNDFADILGQLAARSRVMSRRGSGSNNAANGYESISSDGASEGNNFADPYRPNYYSMMPCEAANATEALAAEAAKDAFAVEAFGRLWECLVGDEGDMVTGGRLTVEADGYFDAEQASGNGCDADAQEGVEGHSMSGGGDGASLSDSLLRRLRFPPPPAASGAYAVIIGREHFGDRSL